jgi:hypothetical protein
VVKHTLPKNSQAPCVLKEQFGARSK